MKTRAAILEEIGRTQPYAESRPLSIEEVELMPPGKGEVLVSIRAAGLCHSDLSVINGDRPRPVPMVLGHEGAGVVEEIGAEVSDLSPGDHVVMAFVPACGHCAPCAVGRPALCEPGARSNTAGTLLSGERRITRRGEPIHHHLGVSAFSRYAVIARNSLIKVDKTVPFAEAALFGCAVMTGVGAVVNTAAVKPGSSVAVIGLGGVGLAAILGARLCGASRIIAIDLIDDKLRLAGELGASAAFNAADPDCAIVLREMTGGGVDYSFEMAGSIKAFELAYAIGRRGGCTVSAGLAHPEAKLALGALSIVAEERVIKGSYLGGSVPSRDIPRYIELYQAGMLPVDRLMSGQIGFEGLNAAFDRLAEGKTVRQVLVP
jgi:alcohol dehydrogenase